MTGFREIAGLSKDDPLSSGSHTIRWIASGCTPGFSLDVTYKLKVE